MSFAEAHRRHLALALVMMGALGSAACNTSNTPRSTPSFRPVITVSGPCGSAAEPATIVKPPSLSHAGIRKIRHVIIIMQENRSFDNYFGTYPGADGLPVKHHRFIGGVPNPSTGGCDSSYHDPGWV